MHYFNGNINVNVNIKGLNLHMITDKVAKV